MEYNYQKSAISNQFPLYCRLDDEKEILEKDKNIRLELIVKFRGLPFELFSRLRHFQPQIGCFNKCAFCSQAASSRIVEFDISSIRNIISAIKAVAIENGIRSGYLPKNTIINGKLSDDFVMPKYGLIAQELDRAGVVYCYLDNDPSLYGKLDILIELLYKNLGVKTRIATVGFSRKNPMLSNMFMRLSKDLYHCLAGVRLSISPYTNGWKNGKSSSMDDFEKDLSHFIKIFEHHILSDLNGRKGACIELRFRPLVIAKEVKVWEYKGFFILFVGNKLFISDKEVVDFPVSTLVNIEHNLKLNHPGISLIQIDEDRRIEDIINGLISNKYDHYKKHTLHKLENEDGIYYVINAERTKDGYSYAKYIYPKTKNRKNSGVIDAERYLLNEMIKVSRNKESFVWGDVIGVLDSLKELSLSKDDETSNYIQNEIITLVESYIRSLKLSGLPAAAFFDKSITVDTGQICNLGRAFDEYKLLASRRDLPMTLNHERSFGANSDLSKEGVVYRLAPGNKRRVSSYILGEQKRLNVNSFIIEKLDLSKTNSYDGQSKEIYEFDMNNIHTIKLKDSMIPMIPGQK